MWNGLQTAISTTNASEDDLLQFQVALNRKLDHAFSNIKDNQILNLDASKVLNLAGVVAESLSAETGYIAELTVDQLDTSLKVQNYLDSDTSDINYIKIYEQNIEFIEATTTGLSTEPAKDRNGNNLYWTDDTNTAVTTTVTSYPVTIYVYTELVKQKLNFQDIGGTLTPLIQMGAGTGVPGSDNGKAFIYKGTDGLYIKYTTTSGDEQIIKNGDNGIEIDGSYITDIQMYTDGMVATFEDGTEYDVDFTKNGSGEITQIVNNTTGVTTNITWNGVSKP